MSGLDGATCERCNAPATQRRFVMTVDAIAIDVHEHLCDGCASEDPPDLSPYL